MDSYLEIVEAYLNTADSARTWRVRQDVVHTEDGRIAVQCEFQNGRVLDQQISRNVLARMVNWNSPLERLNLDEVQKTWKDGYAALRDVIAEKLAVSANAHEPEPELPEWEINPFGKELLDDIMHDGAKPELGDVPIR